MPEDKSTPSNIRAVTRWDVDVLQMPRRRQMIEVDQLFARPDFLRIQLGSWPEEMEDKWVAFYEHPYLYLHRSWTGVLVYRVRFEPSGSDVRAVEVMINRNRRTFRSRESGTVEAQKALLLVRQLLLPEQHVCQSPPAEPERDPAFLRNWSTYGRLLSGPRPPGIPADAWRRNNQVKAYWVIRGKLLAGFYPGDPDPQKAGCKIDWLRKRGIRCFVNLMQEYEVSRLGVVRPYTTALDALKEEEERETEEAFRTETRCLRFPIRDGHVPSAEQMRQTLDAMDQALHNELPVYVHCLGGRGRTGTVVGCYLLRHRLADRTDVFDAIRGLRAAEGLGQDGSSPETDEQRKFVLDWMEHDIGFHRIPTLEDQFRGCLLGLAVGDALGTTLEFNPPGTFEPITDMIGGGPFHLQAGQWTDDTSMALCLADSLLSCDCFNPRDQLERYVRWWRAGYLSSTGDCFDIGNTIREALQKFERTGDVDAGSSDPQKAGNGSIMRLAPIPLFYFDDPRKAIQHAREGSRTTHRARAALDACQFLAALIIGALQGLSKDELLAPDFWPVSGEKPGMHFEIQELLAGSYKRKNPPDIQGTGYVVRSLEAALWAFYHSTTFKEGALLAVNLGDDADTTGAVYGQLAGAYYGASGPARVARQTSCPRAHHGVRRPPPRGHLLMKTANPRDLASAGRPHSAADGILDCVNWSDPRENEIRPALLMTTRSLSVHMLTRAVPPGCSRPAGRACVEH